MKTKNLLTSIWLFSMCLFALAIHSQSISGNVNSGTAAKNLGYANVDIFKNGKLVANVLTDKNGNFSVKLDTGVYQCEIKYAGYEKVTKEITVRKDEKANFNLKKDEKSKYSAMPEHSDVVVFSTSPSYSYSGASYSDSEISYAGGSRSPAITYSNKGAKNMWGSSAKNDSANYGKLTAGEINDFSKWRLWTDLTAGELKTQEQFWNYAPTDRYMVQVKDQNGLPLANALVELLNGSEVIYTSRSDNTGKAELWGSLKYDTLRKISVSAIRTSYKDKDKKINNPKKFESGINSFEFTANCEQSQNVDIAMVVDATGSMQDEIDYLKLDLNNVIFQSKEFSTTLNLRFANIFYRDKGDAYLTETQDFTRVLSESVAFTDRHNADGGGDTEEAVDVALDEAINKLSWGTDTRAKIIFLVLDASPHNTKEIQEKMRNLSMQAAAKGIRIVPVAGSGMTKDTEYLMRCLALATNGTYVFLSNHSGIGNPHIAPSTDSYQVEILNDLLVRVIKSFTYMPNCQQSIADLGVNLPDSQVVVLTYIDTTHIDTSKTINTKTGNPKDTLNLKWSYYPNPTTGIVNIISNKNIEELFITDLSGKVMQSVKDIKSEQQITVDLSGYATGIYLIRYPVEKQWVSGKIVLSR